MPTTNRIPCVASVTELVVADEAVFEEARQTPIELFRLDARISATRGTAAPGSQRTLSLRKRKEAALATAPPSPRRYLVTPSFLFTHHTQSTPTR